MNTLQIYDIIKKDPICSRFFLGVFSRDQLPKKLYNFPCSFIVNTDNQNEPGEHWLAIYYDEKQHATFFDPYGLEPSLYGFETYLNNTSKSWTYNSTRIQSYFSLLCGQICVFFIYLMSKKLSLNYISRLFTKDYEKNEKVILNFLNFNIY